MGRIIIDISTVRAAKEAARHNAHGHTKAFRFRPLRDFAWLYALFLTGGWLLTDLPTIRHVVSGLLSVPRPVSAEDRVTAIIDGDTLVWKGRRVRLHGMDAPEMDQTCRDASRRTYRCGWRARQHLKEIISGRPISCERVTIDRYGRDVAVCLVDGIDIGERMVHDGWAVAYIRYSRAYAWAENVARQHHKGLWQNSFTMPETWRHGD